MPKYKTVANDSKSPMQNLVSRRKEQDTLVKQLNGARLFCALMSWDAAEMYLLQAVAEAECQDSIRKPARDKC